MKTLKKATRQQLFLPIVCVILVLAVNIVYDAANGEASYNFFNIYMNNDMLQGRLINILNRGSEVAILAIGMTLVVSASAGTDISVGSVMSLCALLLLHAHRRIRRVHRGDRQPRPHGAGPHRRPPDGRHVRHLQRRPGGLPGHSAHGGHADSLVRRPRHRPAAVQQPDRLYPCAGVRHPRRLHRRHPTPIIIATACVLMTTLLLKNTAMGLYIQSVGINKKASRIAGLNSKRIIFICYLLCGLCAAIAGIVASTRITSADSNNIGLNMELDAILAVALGGNSPGRR